MAIHEQLLTFKQVCILLRKALDSWLGNAQDDHLGSLQGILDANHWAKGKVADVLGCVVVAHASGAHHHAVVVEVPVAMRSIANTLRKLATPDDGSLHPRYVLGGRRRLQPSRLAHVAVKTPEQVLNF